MFISEKQSNERLNSPRNLANRFRGGRAVTFEEAIVSRELEENDATKGGAPEEEIETRGAEGEESQCVFIEHKEIRRPGNNRPWLSQQERNQIAIAHADGQETQTQIALRHNVQVSTVSDIVNNARRIPETSRSVDQNKVDQALDLVREKAIDRLMKGLGNLTDDKLSALGAKDTASVCASMARVVQQTIPQEKGNTQINLVVYTPELRQEKNFDSVEV